MTIFRVPPARALAAVAFCAAASLPARAQWLGADYAAFGAPQVNYAANSFLNFSVLNNARRDAPSTGTAARAPSTIAPRGGRSTVAAELAAKYPGAQTARLAQAFDDSLSAFEQVANRLGLPRDDVAAALAAFIVGNYIALHGTALPPDAEFVALTGRLRGALAASPAFAQASPAQKRQAYEQLAMVGMFMTTAHMALAKAPDPRAEANVRDHARANLEQLLKVSADRLELQGGSLALR